MKTTKTIIIRNVACPSLNDVLNKHWREQSRIKREMEEAIYWSLMEISSTWVAMAVPVDVRIDAYYLKRVRHDSDNIFDKPIIDAMVKAGILVDDDCDYVRDVTSRAHKGHESNEVVITITKAKKS